MASNAEYVSIWWRHRGTFGNVPGIFVSYIFHKILLSYLTMYSSYFFKAYNFLNGISRNITSMLNTYFPIKLTNSQMSSVAYQLLKVPTQFQPWSPQNPRGIGWGYSFNPLRATFLRENINIYLYFMSFLHTNKTQVVEISPRVRQGPAYAT